MRYLTFVTLQWRFLVRNGITLLLSKFATPKSWTFVWVFQYFTRDGVKPIWSETRR
jgi:hypothetical protein